MFLRSRRSARSPRAGTQTLRPTRASAAIAVFGCVALAGCAATPTASPTVTVTVTASSSPVAPIIEQRDNVVGGADQLPLLGVPQAYNAGDLIPKIQEFYNSGRWNDSVVAITNQARGSINSWIRTSCQEGKGSKISGCRPAVVFDIDDTLVTFFPYYNEVQTDWRYNQATFRDYWSSCQPPAIVPVRDLYNQLVARGVPVILISGRDAHLKDATVKCLTQAGFAPPSAVYLRHPNQKQPAAELKAEYRAKIERGGQTIVANIGDQQADIAGGHQLKAFILPNPMYRLE